MFSFLYVEFSRAFHALARYPVNFVSSLFINVFMFYGLFMGASFLSGLSSFGDALDSMVVAYAAWVLVNRSFGRIPQSIENEAATGVLESIFLSRYSIYMIYAVRGIVDTIFDMLMLVILVLSIEFLTNSKLTYSLTILLPIITISFASIGCGMIAGGFALKLKRISAILPSFQFILMFLMFAPFETWSEQLNIAVMVLPMVPSVILLRELMVHELALNYELAVAALLNGVGYLILGSLLFHLIVKRVRSKGAIGGY